MKLSVKQLDKLSELFIDLAKGLFLAAAAAPIVVTNNSTFVSLRSAVIGCLFTYFSLKIIEYKETKS